MNFSEIATLEASEIATLPIADLKEFSTLLGKQEAGVKAAKGKLGEAMKIRFCEKVQQLRELQNKPIGNVTAAIEGEAIKGEIRKTVNWDSAKLQEALASLPAEVVANLDITVSAKISEKSYEASTPEVRAALDQARTIVLSSESLAFKR